MKEIKLGKSDKVAIVDDEDFEEISKHRWYYAKNGNKMGYAYRMADKDITIDGIIEKKKTMIGMHRQLMNFPESLLVDHINRNGLDNRMFNLRLANRADNRRNTSPIGHSKYMGVYLNKKANKWIANINIDGVRKYLGIFKLEIDAAKAFDKAAKETGNPFYYINFPEYWK